MFDIATSFNHGKVQDVIEGFKLLCHQTEEYLPVHGPLPKSVYTYQFEELTRKMMNGEDFTYELVDNQQHIIFSDGSNFNLTKIVTHANFEHLTFSELDLSAYVTYMATTSKVKTDLPGLKGKLPKEADFIKHGATKDKIGDLSYAEKIALNIYSTAFHHRMNAFLRGTIEETSPQKIRDVIVHTAISLSGLTKAPATQISGAFRYEGLWDADTHAKRVTMSEKGMISTEKGFISTGIIPIKNFKTSLGKNTEAVAISYSGLKGIYMPSLSMNAYEKEFVIPPTQIKWSGYHKGKDNIHYFLACPVLDLSMLHEQSLTLPTDDEKAHFLFSALLQQAQGLRKQIRLECGKTMEQSLHEELVLIEKNISQLRTKLKDESLSVADIASELDEFQEKLNDLHERVHMNQQGHSNIKTSLSGMQKKPEINEPTSSMKKPNFEPKI